MGWPHDSLGVAVSSRPLENRGLKHAVSAKVLDVIADGSFYYNATQIQQDPISTYTDPNTGLVHRAAVFTAYNKKAYLYHWMIEPDSIVSVISLSDIAGNPFATYTEQDLHCAYSIIWDSQGYLHVLGNSHGANALFYAVTTNPVDITAWSTPGMGADMAALVTANNLFLSYPRFLNLPGGDLVFSWRQGASGAGDVYWKRMNINTGVWTNLVLVLQGTTSSPEQSAYYGRQYVQADGSSSGIIHTFFIWVGATDGGYDNLCYARSHDGGATWHDVQENALTLPIVPQETSGTHAKIYSTSDALGSQALINACPAWVDQQGNPHTVNLASVADAVSGVYNRQIMHLWWNGTAWVNQILTNMQESGTPPGGGNPAAPTGQITSPMIFGSPDGKIWISYGHRLDNQRSAYRCIDVSEPFKSFPLVKLDNFYGDCCYDSYALAQRNELVFLMIPSVLDPTTGGGGAYGSQLAGGYLNVPGSQNWKGRWQGTWNSATAYVINDLVLSAGAVYQCILGVTSATAPASDGTHWSAVTFAVGDCASVVGPIVPGSAVVTGTTNRTYSRLTTGTASGADITVDSTNWLTAGVEDWFMGQPAVVITVDTNQMGKLQAHGAQLPYIKTVAGMAVASDTSTSSGSWAQPPTAQSLMVPGELRGAGTTYQGTWNSATAYSVGDSVTYGSYNLEYRRLVAGTTSTTPDVDRVNWRPNIGSGAAVMVRLVARALSGAVGRMLLLHVLERDAGPVGSGASNQSRTFGTLAFPDQVSSALQQTPWMPCRLGAFRGRDVELRIEGRQFNAGGTNNTVSCRLEVGVIAGPGTGIE